MAKTFRGTHFEYAYCERLRVGHFPFFSIFDFSECVKHLALLAEFVTRPTLSQF